MNRKNVMFRGSREREEERSLDVTAAFAHAGDLSAPGHGHPLFSSVVVTRPS